MGLAGLAGKVTDSYPTMDVKAGIILDMCVCVCACGRVCEDRGRGCQNTQVALIASLVTALEWRPDIRNTFPLCRAHLWGLRCKETCYFTATVSARSTNGCMIIMIILQNFYTFVHTCVLTFTKKTAFVSWFCNTHTIALNELYQKNNRKATAATSVV